MQEPRLFLVKALFQPRASQDHNHAEDSGTGPHRPTCSGFVLVNQQLCLDAQMNHTDNDGLDLPERLVPLLGQIEASVRRSTWSREHRRPVSPGLADAEQTAFPSPGLSFSFLKQVVPI